VAAAGSAQAQTTTTRQAGDATITTGGDGATQVCQLVGR
jgi:hypothetical protein